MSSQEEMLTSFPQTHALSQGESIDRGCPYWFCWLFGVCDQSTPTDQVTHVIFTAPSKFKPMQISAMMKNKHWNWKSILLKTSHSSSMMKWEGVLKDRQSAAEKKNISNQNGQILFSPLTFRCIMG